MFYEIDERMNESDEVWSLVHQKYVMSRIIQKLYSIGKTTDITLLLPMMFGWIDEMMNGSDYFWWNRQNNEW